MERELKELKFNYLRGEGTKERKRLENERLEGQIERERRKMKMFTAMLEDWKDEKEAVEKANAAKQKRPTESLTPVEKDDEAAVIIDDDEGIFGLTNLDVDDSASVTK